MNYAWRDRWLTRLLTTRSLVWIWHQSKVTSSASLHSCVVICMKWPITDSNGFSGQGLSTCQSMHRNTISGTRANEYGMFMWKYCLFYFYFSLLLYGRKGCFHSLIPMDTILKSFNHNVIFFREESTFKYWFSFGNHFFLAALFTFWKMRVFLSQILPDQGNWIQIFTSKKQSHSTSYCLHGHESSGMNVFCE